jgi:Ca-activated chloride channel family protein
MPFSVRADRRLIRATAPSRRFVRVEITAPEAPRRADRIPVNLAFVIDRSGSMAGDKIRKAREAAIQGIRALRAEDRFAVVAYDDHVDVVVPSSLATPEARAEAEERIAGIGDRGSTDLHAGWLAGCEEIGRALRDDAVGRCLLLTDGLANQGITSPDEIASRVASGSAGSAPRSAWAPTSTSTARPGGRAGGGNHFIEGRRNPQFMGRVGRRSPSPPATSCSWSRRGRARSSSR